MAQLTPYLPIDRRLALADGTALPENVRGTALVADISGFTPLAAALVSELGQEQGVEELTQRLNHVYATCIEQVHDFRGSVVNFAGAPGKPGVPHSQQPGALLRRIW